MGTSRSHCGFTRERQTLGISPSKDCYGHIRKGYQGKTTPTETQKGPQKNYKKVPRSLSDRRRQHHSPDPAANQVIGGQQIGPPPSTGLGEHQRTLALRGAAEASCSEREEEQGGPSAGDTPCANLGPDLAVLLEDGKKRSQITIPAHRRPKRLPRSILA
jgi:hypothetical protein